MADNRTSDWLKGRFSALVGALRNIQVEQDQAALQGWLDGYKAFSKEVEQVLSEAAGWKRGPSIELAVGPRSRMQMLHLLPAVQKHLQARPKGEVASILDVNCEYGQGPAMLAAFYQSSALGHRLRVVGAETNAAQVRYARAVAQGYRILHSSVEKIADTFDFVTSRFAIQKQEDPAAYAKALQERAKARVFVLAPYQEPADKLSPSHKVSLTDEILSSIGAENIQIFTTPVWGAFNDPPYEVVAFELPGAAPEHVEQPAS